MKLFLFIIGAIIVVQTYAIFYNYLKTCAYKMRLLYKMLYYGRGVKVPMTLSYMIGTLEMDASSVTLLLKHLEKQGIVTILWIDLGQGMTQTPTWVLNDVKLTEKGHKRAEEIVDEQRALYFN